MRKRRKSDALTDQVSASTQRRKLGRKQWRPISMYDYNSNQEAVKRARSNAVARALGLYAPFGRDLDRATHTDTEGEA